jgi:hypothetical protein
MHANKKTPHKRQNPAPSSGEQPSMRRFIAAGARSGPPRAEQAKREWPHIRAPRAGISGSLSLSRCVLSVLTTAGLMLTAGSALAAEPSIFDNVELRFAQAKTQAGALPLSRDELFGDAPAKPAAPAPAAPVQPASRAAPNSRDSLFDVPADVPANAPAAPDANAVQAAPSRDELFGAPSSASSSVSPAAASGIKWSGFFNEELAYTYPDTGHWSRAVSRLEVAGRGSLSPGFKYKISARVDADPVYMSSDYYPGDVKRDQRQDFFLRENYLDFSAAGLDFRLGRQQIVWGEMVGLFFADVVSARDMREFILPGFDILRIPQWAARAEYFGDNFHAEAVWIPVQSVDEIGKPGADFYPAGMMAEGVPGARFASDDKPAHTLANSAYGLRMNTLTNGWDLAAFFYRSHSATPTFYRDIEGPADVVFTPRHDRIWQVGSTLSKDFGDFILRAEAIYTDGQSYSVSTPTDSDGVIQRNTFEYVVGLDFSLPHETRLNVQAFQRVFFGSVDNLIPDTEGYGASVLLSSKITSTLEPQILWIQSLSNGGDRLIRPRLNWHVARNTTLAFGADIFAGPDTGFFGRYGDRDRLYTELRYDF